jgi:hypothetical protein
MIGWLMNSGVVCGMRIGRESQNIGRKSDSVSLCPPQIPCDQTWDRTRGGNPATNCMSYGMTPKPELTRNIKQRDYLWGFLWRCILWPTGKYKHDTIYKENNKFLEELTAYFLFLLHGPHIKRFVQQLFYRCLCISCRGNVFTKSLSSNDTWILIDTHKLWEGFINYVIVLGSDAIIYIPNFVRIGSGSQKLIEGDTQTHRQHEECISLLLFPKNKESRLKTNLNQTKMNLRIFCDRGSTLAYPEFKSRASPLENAAHLSIIFIGISADGPASKRYSIWEQNSLDLQYICTDPPPPLPSITTCEK